MCDSHTPVVFFKLVALGAYRPRSTKKFASNGTLNVRSHILCAKVLVPLLGDTPDVPVYVFELFT
jgi:hypothetical protein